MDNRLKFEIAGFIVAVLGMGLDFRSIFTVEQPLVEYIDKPVVQEKIVTIKPDYTELLENKQEICHYFIEREYNSKLISSMRIPVIHTECERKIEEFVERNK